jgi:hypothetical protein
MTPKEKAESIFHQMYKILWHTNAEPIHCKECALIAVDEILLIDCWDMSEEHFDNHIEYWEKVKNEIENL